MRDRECAAKAGDRAGDSLALPHYRSKGNQRHDGGERVKGSLEDNY